MSRLARADLPAVMGVMDADPGTRDRHRPTARRHQVWHERSGRAACRVGRRIVAEALLVEPSAGLAGLPSGPSPAGDTPGTSAVAFGLAAAAFGVGATGGRPGGGIGGGHRPGHGRRAARRSSGTGTRSAPSAGAPGRGRGRGHRRMPAIRSTRGHRRRASTSRWRVTRRPRSGCSRPDVHRSASGDPSARARRRWWRRSCPGCWRPVGRWSW